MSVHMSTDVHTQQHIRKIKRERLLVFLIILIALASSAATILLIDTLRNDLSAFRSNEMPYYSQPVEVFTRSAGGTGVRSAYVKVSFIASFDNQNDMRQFNHSQTRFTDAASSVIRSQNPNELLNPGHWDYVASEILQRYSESSLPAPANLYLDRLTIQ